MVSASCCTGGQGLPPACGGPCTHAAPYPHTTLRPAWPLPPTTPPLRPPPPQLHQPNRQPFRRPDRPCVLHARAPAAEAVDRAKRHRGDQARGGGQAWPPVCVQCTLCTSPTALVRVPGGCARAGTWRWRRRSMRTPLSTLCSQWQSSWRWAARSDENQPNRNARVRAVAARTVEAVAVAAPHGAMGCLACHAPCMAAPEPRGPGQHGGVALHAAHRARQPSLGVCPCARCTGAPLLGTLRTAPPLPLLLQVISGSQSYLARKRERHRITVVRVRDCVCVCVCV